MPSIKGNQPWIAENMDKANWWFENKFTEPERDRFITKIEFGTIPSGFDSSCWNWLGSLTVDGWPKFHIRPEKNKHTYILAHRMSYRIFRNILNSKMTLDHLCSNKICVNPWHLEEVESEENTSRYFQKALICRRGHVLINNKIIVGKRRYCNICYKNGKNQYKMKRKNYEKQGN